MCCVAPQLFNPLPVHAASPATAPADAEAMNILEASDAIRFPSRSFRMNIDLFEYRGGKQVESLLLTVFARIDPETRAIGNLVRYERPAKDSGKLMLFHGRDLWYYDPASHANIRLSPQQRLIGQAANGDVMATRFASDYTAAHAGEEEVSDGEQVKRECVKLLLGAATPTATYDKIEYWVEKGSYRPVKAKFLSQSGQLLKTAYYRKFETSLDSPRPMEMVIIDGLNAGLVTIMRFSKFSYRTVPVSWMQRDFLPRFQEN
jgi:hypothetical protein